MPQLIEELKKEHQELLDALYKIKELSIVKKEGQELLLSIKEQLLEHLRKEDRELYPYLNEKAIHDDNLRNTLDVLAFDMNEITLSVEDFFNRYSKVSQFSPPSRYIVECSNLLGKLYGRIHKEERVIYREYVKQKSQFSTKKKAQ